MASPCQVIAEDISRNNGYVELSFQARKLDDKVGGWAPPRGAGGWEGDGEAQPRPSFAPTHQRLHLQDDTGQN